MWKRVRELGNWVGTWVSWILLGAAAITLVAVSGDLGSRLLLGGESISRVRGLSLGKLRLENRDHEAIEIRHPAVIAFSNVGCEHCMGIQERLLQAQSGSSSRLQVYVLFRDSLPPAGIGLDAGALLLREGSPSLGFIQQVPTVVRTDAEGRIAAGFVGRGTIRGLQRLFR